MEKTMLGLVTNPDGVVALEEVPVPRLGENPYAPHDVLLEVEYCGICGSDIHKWGAGKEDAAKVLHPERKGVQGHEIVARVREIGQKVTRVTPGDRVVCEIVTFYCGHCPACLEGRFNICNTLKPMDGRAHYVTGGGFAKYTVWPEFQLHVLPEDVHRNPPSSWNRRQALSTASSPGWESVRGSQWPYSARVRGVSCSCRSAGRSARDRST